MGGIETPGTGGGKRVDAAGGSVADAGKDSRASGSDASDAKPANRTSTDASHATPDASRTCHALTACCTVMDASFANVCMLFVQDGDEAACRNALGSYKSDSFCP